VIEESDVCLQVHWFLQLLDDSFLYLIA